MNNYDAFLIKNAFTAYLRCSKTTNIRVKILSEKKDYPFWLQMRAHAPARPRARATRTRFPEIGKQLHYLWFFFMCGRDIRYPRLRRGEIISIYPHLGRPSRSVKLKSRPVSQGPQGSKTCRSGVLGTFKPRFDDLEVHGTRAWKIRVVTLAANGTKLNRKCRKLDQHPTKIPTWKGSTCRVQNPRHISCP